MTATADAVSVPSVVIYGDFNCPFSAIASRRAARLVAGGRLHVDWRCIEHDPSIGVNEPPMSPEQSTMFADELRQIAELLTPDEPNELRIPTRRLRTGPVNQVYAATPPRLRPMLRTALFDAYWVDGRDLASDSVLDEILGTVGVADEDRPPNVDVEASVTAWQREWAGLPGSIVPAMVFANGVVSRGLGVLTRLAGDAVAVPDPGPDS